MAEDWRKAVLDIMGAPATGTNLTVLSTWAVSEGMPAGYNNWLATTENGYGGRVVNSVGVKAYPSIENGAAATVKTLSNGRYNDVLKALRDGTSLTRAFAAINQSPWCGGCQSGHYPIALYNYIIDVQHGHVPPPSPSPPEPPPAAPTSSKNRQHAKSGWHAFISYWNQVGPGQADKIAGIRKSIGRI